MRAAQSSAEKRRGVRYPGPLGRSGRVAEGGALLRRYGGKYLRRGFESLLLRSNLVPPTRVEQRRSWIAVFADGPPFGILAGGANALGLVGISIDPTSSNAGGLSAGCR